LQGRAARAQPAEHTETVDGWWLRHAPGGAWWIGSVLPHGAVGAGEVARRVAGAEEFYARRGARARFQISPGACPDGLDTLLATRGYRRHAPMSLRMAPTARVRPRAAAGAPPVRVDDRPSRAWFGTWYGVPGHGDARAGWDMLARLDLPCAYAGALVGDEVVAVGRAVADTGWVGVFGIATLPGARGRGAAGAVLAALAGWAGGQRADHMYLQVERDNVAALRLYQRAGFTEVSGYHYRSAG
jgi:ribosomal protein S18 acetylase RimI-like enzyme